MRCSDTQVLPVWWRQLDLLLDLVVGPTDVEVSRLNGIAHRRKNEPGWEPDAGVQAFIAELWERCYGGS